MAQVDLFSIPDDDPSPQTGTPVRVGGSVFAGQSGPIDIAPGLDVSAIERELRADGGGLFDPSDLEGVLRNTGYNAGATSLEQAMANAKATYAQRRGNAAATSGGGGPRALAGDQFDDAYSKQLEGIAKAQMGEVRSNPGLDTLLSFLDQEFTRLSTNPGFRPEELATINTQMFEPIEQRRHASHQRAVQRASARGFLPTSGLTYLTEDPQGGEETLDTTYDRMRTQAGRDLSIKAIDQRRDDLARALDLGRVMGLQIPQAQRAEELGLAQLLYNMPRQSLMDLLAVLNGSPSSMDLMSGSIAAQNANLYAQQQNDARNAALMEQIGAIVGSLFGGR